jgi:putative glycosyltransferase (TIGR04348 family)
MQKPPAKRRTAKRLARVVIVTPYLADANNGNWRTAERWRAMLAPSFEAIVQNDWHDSQDDACDLLIALHARRTHATVARYREAHPHAPLIVTLTGTDLYKDLAAKPPDADALDSIHLANALIVLQEDAIRHVPKTARNNAHVIYQSCPPLPAATRARGRLQCVVVGHLRDEKSPQTIFAAVRLLAHERSIFIDHIGAGLDPALEREAHALAATHPNYRYLGALPHESTRAAIASAHVLIHPSIMEGGANVVVEAVVSGTPVVASRMSGNVGMLGADYPGYFPVGHSRRLASMLRTLAKNPATLATLRQFARQRKPLFAPALESAKLHALVGSLLAPPTEQAR